MIHRMPSRRHFHYSYLGLFLIIAMMLGGGTRTSLPEDFILGILALPFLFKLFTNSPIGKWQWVSLGFGATVVLLPLLQMTPGFGFTERTFPGTLDAGRTLAAALYCLVLVAIFYGFMSHQSKKQEPGQPGGLEQLLPFFMIGVFLNFAPSFLQFGSREFAQLLQPFSYKISAGLFANENHLSLLFVISVPLLIVLFRQTRFPLLCIPLILLLMLFQLVVGSRAGIAMIAVASIASYLFIVARSWLLAGILLLLAVGGGYFLITGAEPIKDFDPQNNFNRLTFLNNTIAAIKDHMPFGTGIGTFTLIYPQYGFSTGVFSNYVNHTHNDYLELVLEGGIFAAGLILVYFSILTMRVMSLRQNLTDMHRAALLGIFFILLHSIVDYPLRTMTIATSFTLFNAILFATSNGNMKTRRSKTKTP